MVERQTENLEVNGSNPFLDILVNLYKVNFVYLFIFLFFIFKLILYVIFKINFFILSLFLFIFILFCLNKNYFNNDNSNFDLIFKFVKTIWFKPFFFITFFKLEFKKFFFFIKKIYFRVFYYNFSIFFKNIISKFFLI